jgi:hypothetical protein
MRALAHLTAGVLALSAVALWAPPFEVTAHVWPGGSLRLAKEYQSRRFKETDDRNSDDDFGKTSSPLPKSPGRMKSSPGGYDARRVQRFWRHYHGARPEKKEKPLEREK